MAAELPRPGVEIIQQFTSAAPTIIRPTLVPFITGPAKEIVEVTNADGTINSNAKQGTYSQLPKVISQTSFPSPRGNIAEVDVEEETIKVFLLFGGNLEELERDPGESFLVAQNDAMRPAFRSSFFTTSTGLALNGLVLVLAFDVTAPANHTKDITVTFSSDGSNLTPTQIVNQINAAVGQNVASAITITSKTRIQIASLEYGAAASVTIRAGGSANTLFGLVASSEYRVTGPGFRAQDQNNNTTLSPWIEWTPGVYLVDNVSTTLPAYDDSIPSAGFGIGFLDTAGTFKVALVDSTTAFTGNSSLDLKVGDKFYADGVLPNSSAVIMKVETGRFKLGVLNAKLSVFDANGKVTSAVYDESPVNTLLSSAPFAPQYAWFMATNLLPNTTATAAKLTGAVEGAPATTATVTAPGVPAGSTPFALAGLTLKFDVTVDGVALATQTFTFTGGPFTALADIVNAVNAGGLTGMFAQTDLGGTKIAFSTNKTGALQAITLRADSTGLVALGFVASTAYSATGTDVTFVNVPATLVGGTQTFPMTLAGPGETLVVKKSTDGGTTFGTTATHTFSTQAFANIAALVAELTSGSSWGGAGPAAVGLAVTNQNNKLVIKSVATGSTIALKVDATSTSIGASASTQILYTSNQQDVGEDELNGHHFKFTLNNRPHTYDVVFTSDSLVDAVAAINAVAGTTVASIGGTSSDEMVLTSDLKGYASSINVVADSTTTSANAALGFTSGNQTATGTGRPNPDFYVDGSGNVVLGADILRSALTGAPFDPGTADVYIQYHGLRKDVSALAKTPGLLRLSDVTTLQTVLSPLTTDNPLGLAMFFAMINASNIEIAGLGVDETTAASPEGTLAAYTRAANFIESQEVYAIAPLTQDPTVHQMFDTHVVFMSGETQKGERIVFIAPENPTRAVDKVLGSGLSGNTTATTNQFLLDVNITAALTAAGLNPLSLAVSDDVFLEVTVATGAVDEVRKYNLSTVNGVLCVINTTFSSTQNTDGFYSTTPLTETLVNADWSVKIRGGKLLISGSTLPDKDKIAETVAAANGAYKQRRVYSVFPDMVKATVGGLEQSIPSYYAAAAVCGMVAFYPPQQGFTNMPIVGFTGVLGSQDTYSEKQLNTMAAGGTFILVQDAVGAPVVCRHQLSTDVSLLETRELSITKVVDYVAKFLRTGLRNFIGTFNITQSFLDTLSTVIQGMLGFLVENGVLNGGDLNNLIQDKENPDTVLVDVTLDVPIPCNYIRLTLAI